VLLVLIHLWLNHNCCSLNKNKALIVKLLIMFYICKDFLLSTQYIITLCLNNKLCLDHNTPWIDVSTSRLWDHLKWRFVTQMAGNHNTYHLNETEDWIFCVTLATHTCNVWCNMFPAFVGASDVNSSVLSIRELSVWLLFQCCGLLCSSGPYHVSWPAGQRQTPDQQGSSILHNNTTNLAWMQNRCHNLH